PREPHSLTAACLRRAPASAPPAAQDRCPCATAPDATAPPGHSGHGGCPMVDSRPLSLLLRVALTCCNSWPAQPDRTTTEPSMVALSGTDTLTTTGTIGPAHFLSTC